MIKSHHPLNKYERLVNAEKKAQARARRKVGDGAVRAARERIKIQELEEDAISSGEDRTY